MAQGSAIWRAPAGIVARWTGRAEGDLGHGGRYVSTVDPDVEGRRRAVLDRSWSWVRQVHGAAVAVADRPGGGAGTVADALVSARADTALAVLTADCAPVALASPEGVLAAAHGGWRGLLAGVIERTVEAMSGLGATHIVAAVGPCVRAECYEFGVEDLDQVAARLGRSVRSVTADGKPALDLVAAVAATLQRAGVSDVDLTSAACTACCPDYFSHRARGEAQRQALVVWRRPPGSHG